MKTKEQVVIDIIDLIDVSAVRTLLAGGSIWPNERPSNSKKIDIVVNCFSLTNTQDQLGSPNINIWVPNKTPNINGVVQQLPDNTTFAAIAALIRPLVETQYRETFRTMIIDPGTVDKAPDGSWYMSIGLSYMSMQENYRNI